MSQVDLSCRNHWGPGGMDGQLLGTCTALAEDSGLVPNTLIKVL